MSVAVRDIPAVTDKEIARWSQKENRMTALAAMAGMFVFFLVAITAAYAWEKRLVWPYVPEHEMPPGQVPPPNSYANAAASAAATAGFAHWGTFGDGKGKMYQLRYEFYRSPSGDVLALVGTGTLLSMPLQTTWLFSLLSDDRCLITFDHQNGAEVDLTGLSEEALIPDVPFEKLLKTHRGRLAAASCTPNLFGEVNPLVAFREYKQRRVDLLIARGYAAFIDSEKNAWRYSIKGAMVMSFRQLFSGLRRNVVSDKDKLMANRRL
jgi:hypothetical protein